MLTGDKIETAKCIAISAGLKNKTQEIKEIKECANESQVKEALDSC
jgi:magnesium-transporting ATPase (P-type)